MAEANAGSTLSGAVLQAGDRVQAIAQLIDAGTDAHIWAAYYSRGLVDLLAMQNEIAERVASAIRTQFDVVEGLTPLALVLASAVLRDYLQGRHLPSRRTVPEQLEAARNRERRRGTGIPAVMTSRADEAEFLPSPPPAAL